ncbi:MAG: glycosyltransferase family 4 protein, partial [Candidatus Kerfeldbacteria bacterium]|nr:glycosyltransferase family 4 protein [Candidatus Kerfeldbacteria bacterium]
GGFAPPKNLGLMIAAFALLRKTQAARLWLIGPTYRRSYRRVIERMIDEWKLRDAVTIVDFLPKSQLNIYYNAADVLAVTSNQDEGGPTVVLEALSLGLPVVATPVGFTRDIVDRSPKNLRLVEPTPAAVAEGLQQTLSSKERAAPMSVWTWDDVMNVVKPLYEQLFRTPT